MKIRCRPSKRSCLITTVRVPGVSSEGQELGQPLRLLAEEGREAEASRPAASSPQGSPHASEMLAGSEVLAGSDLVVRGGQTARRSARTGGFARRGGRATSRPKQPIVWDQPGSSSMPSRGGTSSSGLDTLHRINPMTRGMTQNQGFQRGNRARRMRKQGFRSPF